MSEKYLPKFHRSKPYSYRVIFHSHWIIGVFASLRFVFAQVLVANSIYFSSMFFSSHMRTYRTTRRLDQYSRYSSSTTGFFFLLWLWSFLLHSPRLVSLFRCKNVCINNSTAVDSIYLENILNMRLPLVLWAKLNVVFIVDRHSHAVINNYARHFIFLFFRMEMFFLVKQKDFWREW